MLTAYYDTDCALCGRSMLWVKSWWPKGLPLDWRPYTEARPDAPKWDPDQMLVREGDRWFFGADAVLRLMCEGSIPFVAAAAIGGLPFVRPLCRLVYAWVARRRQSF